MPADSPMPASLTATVGGVDYVFKIPTIFDEIHIGQRCKDIRKRAAPESDGSGEGVDDWTNMFTRACAVFELLLEKAGEQWPFTAGKAGPIVDAAQFPANKIEVIVDVYLEFQKQLSSFRTGGNPGKSSASAQAVSG